MSLQLDRKVSTARRLKSYPKAVCVCVCSGDSGVNWNFLSFKNDGQGRRAPLVPGKFG